ncbi:MAG: hypothetical protein ACKV2T_02090 [Kofleriaceae bacterium]
MFHRAVVLLVLVLGAVAQAAPATFEVMTYEAPKGWKVTSTKAGVQMQTIDERAGTFALITMAPTIASQGSADADFNAAWSSSVAQMFKISGTPDIVPGDSENGWTSKAGTAAGEANGLQAVVILVTMTGHGRAMNVVIALNNDKYQGAIQTFLESVKMGVPKTKAPVVPQQPPPATNAPSTPPTSATASKKNGTGSTSTTFDDGWTATIEENWVRVTRPGITVLLHYGIALDDNSRHDPTSALWNRLVAPRYASVKNYNAPSYSELNFPFYEATADATERDGATKFVMMRLSIGGGIARAIEVIASSRQAYDKQFANRDVVLAIMNANRFAVGAEVTGTWSSSDSASVDMYYVATGGYAGMNATSMYDRFDLNADGKYLSEHKGAVGRVGSQNLYQVKYKGTWRVTGPWEITVKRSDKTETTVYSAQYEAVRGGRVLRLTDKKYTSSGYALRREK